MSKETREATEEYSAGLRRVWGAWRMSSHLLSLVVLELIWVHATATLSHGADVAKGKIPFRYARPITHKDSDCDA